LFAPSTRLIKNKNNPSLCSDETSGGTEAVSIKRGAYNRNTNPPDFRDGRVRDGGRKKKKKKKLAQFFLLKTLTSIQFPTTKGRLIGATPQHGAGSRQAEIVAWLEAHGSKYGVTGWVAIDDIDMRYGEHAALMRAHLCHTQSSIGLEETQVTQAVEMAMLGVWDKKK
jgi:hypothetical protein